MPRLLIRCKSSLCCEEYFRPGPPDRVHFALCQVSRYLLVSSSEQIEERKLSLRNQGGLGALGLMSHCKEKGETTMPGWWKHLPQNNHNNSNTINTQGRLPGHATGIITNGPALRRALGLILFCHHLEIVSNFFTNICILHWAPQSGTRFYQ